MVTQAEVLRAIKGTASKIKVEASHLIVEARAGTGKTFTLVEGLNRIRGKPTPGIIGSPQQEEVWREMLKGRPPRSVTFCAFNKAIAQELAQKVPKDCKASTMHSLGFSSILRSGHKPEVSEWKTVEPLSELMGMEARELRRQRQAFLFACCKLVSLCKQNLIPWTDPEEILHENLDQLCGRYEVELNGHREEVFSLIPVLLQRSSEDLSLVDYDDMIWLPVVRGDLQVFQSDLLLVDEAQDLNHAQQELALLAGRRLVLCGDPCQAIYGFAGADVDSIPTMREKLSKDSRGVKVLPLTVTRRCGKAIVQRACRLVPDFQAFEENPGGSIAYMTEDKITPSEGDMILCRVNAPLVSLCFRLIQSGVKATIQGRDIGEGLIRLIDKLCPSSVEDLIYGIDCYYRREVQRIHARRHPSEAGVIALQDKRDCLLAFCIGTGATEPPNSWSWLASRAESVEKVKDRIRNVFSSDTRGVLLSSIHRAKGLEADRVYILYPDLLPHPMAKSSWQRGQEKNLEYVALTRAIHQLTFVHRSLGKR